MFDEEFGVAAQDPRDLTQPRGKQDWQERPHAIWYESPRVYGFRVEGLWSPGQNRFPDNIGFATGENVCAGGNSGPCNDSTSCPGSIPTTTAP